MDLEYRQNSRIQGIGGWPQGKNVQLFLFIIADLNLWPIVYISVIVPTSTQNVSTKQE